MRIHKTKFAFLTKRHLEHLNKFTGYRSVMWRRLDFCIVYVWHAKKLAIRYPLCWMWQWQCATVFHMLRCSQIVVVVVFFLLFWINTMFWCMCDIVSCVSGVHNTFRTVIVCSFFLFAVNSSMVNFHRIFHDDLVLVPFVIYYRIDGEACLRWMESSLWFLVFSPSMRKRAQILNFLSLFK